MSLHAAPHSSARFGGGPISLASKLAPGDGLSKFEVVTTGSKLTATDVEWTSDDGPEIKGPLASIIISLTGRKAGLADLSGEGLATLSARL